MSFILPLPSPSPNRSKVYPHFPAFESDLLSTQLKKSDSNVTTKDTVLQKNGRNTSEFDNNLSGKPIKDITYQKNIRNTLESEFHMPGITRTSTIYHKKISYKPESELRLTDMIRKESNFQTNNIRSTQNINVNTFESDLNPFEPPLQTLLSYRKNKKLSSESDFLLMNNIRKESNYQSNNIKSAQNINLNITDIRNSTEQFKRKKLKELTLFEEKFSRRNEGKEDIEGTEDIFEETEEKGERKESSLKKFSLKVREMGEKEKSENNVILYLFCMELFHFFCYINIILYLESL